MSYITPFTEDEWTDMRRYIANGHAVPKWIERDPARHFKRWCLHWDTQEMKRWAALAEPMLEAKP